MNDPLGFICGELTRSICSIRCIRAQTCAAAFVVAGLIGFLSPPARAVDFISSVAIVEKTVGCTDCMDWKFVGMCFWLKCKLFDCDIEESPKISQFVPDLVVATHTSKDSPLGDVKSLNPVKNANLTNKLQQAEDLETNVDFKHAEVLGNPAALVFNALASSDWFCASGVKVPYFPYFLSGLDKSWRDSGVEHFFPQSILGFPKIKTNWPLGYWAPVYPRCGWGLHPYDAINGAVAAHRAAVITTSALAPHIYIQAGTDCGSRCWGPSTVTEGNIRNHKFQMLFPKTANRGMVMGGDASWANGKNVDGEEGYAWTLWRPYTCCKRKGSFLFSVDW
jgi:integrating conjugative element protein (TIGR03756 family)